ncbi:MAG: hypothetical protein ACFFG0_22575 [Candidatus Thorarchaeota archaeon]
MTEKNCLTCKKFIMNKLVKKGNKEYTQGFAFGQEEKPCEHYPDNLSTTRDIMEGFSCNNYDAAQLDKKLLNTIETHMHKIPFNTPFGMGFPIVSYGSSNIINNKAIEKLDRALRRLYFIVGVFIGITFGISIMATIYSLIGLLGW